MTVAGIVRHRFNEQLVALHPRSRKVPAQLFLPMARLLGAIMYLTNHINFGTI